VVVKLLRGFAYVWFVLAGCFILLNLLSIWYFQGFARLQEIMSPFNVVNFIVTLITLSPGIGAYLLAQKFERQQDGRQRAGRRDADEQLDGMVHSPAQDVLSLYGDLLQERSRLLLPESSLPASKDSIKAALLAEAMRNRGDGEFQRQYVATLRTCYGLLASFVPDPVAERNRDLTADGKASAQSGSDPIPVSRSADLRAMSDGMARLIEEFDRHLGDAGK